MSIPVDDPDFSSETFDFLSERELAFANTVPAGGWTVTGGETTVQLLSLPFLPHPADDIPILFVHLLVECASHAQITLTTQGRRERAYDPLLVFEPDSSRDREALYGEVVLRDYAYTTGSFESLTDTSWELQLRSDDSLHVVDQTTYGLMWERSC